MIKIWFAHLGSFWGSLPDTSRQISEFLFMLFVHEFTFFWLCIYEQYETNANSLISLLAKSLVTTANILKTRAGSSEAFSSMNHTMARFRWFRCISFFFFFFFFFWYAVNYKCFTKVWLVRENIDFWFAKDGTEWTNS